MPMERRISSKICSRRQMYESLAAVVIQCFLYRYIVAAKVGTKVGTKNRYQKSVLSKVQTLVQGIEQFLPISARTSSPAISSWLVPPVVDAVA